jgi:hypothetical protein
MVKDSNPMNPYLCKVFWCTVTCCGLIMIGSTARAQEAIGINVVPAGGGGALSSSGSELLPQLQDLIENQGLFDALEGRAFTASLRYGEVNDAMRITRNAAGTSATVTSRLTGLNRTFTASNPDQLRHEIEDFLKKEGSQDYAEFLGAINRESVLGLIDGNPHAATALLAQDAFYRWGLSPVDEMGNSTTGFDIRLDGGAGHLETRGFSGRYYDAALSFAWQFSKPVGIALSIPFEQREIADATSYIVGANLGLPITFIQRQGDGVAWRVTPFGSTFGAYSGDLVAGGLSFGGGVVSAVQLRGGRLELTIANQASYTGGVPLSVRDIDIKTDVDQWLFKNGAALGFALTKGLIIDGGIAYSNYLRGAAIPAWWTASAGVNLQFADHSGLWLGYRGDFANDYNGNAAVAAIYVRL